MRRDGQISEIAEVDVKEVAAWQTDRIILSGASLEDAIARINRYTETKVVLVGGHSLTVRIAGMFYAGDPDAFVRGLVVRFGCRSERPSPKRIEVDCSEGSRTYRPESNDP